MLLKLAWRNLWRNRRRTWITLTSVFFAVILSTLMMSLKEGVYLKMIEGMVAAYSGQAQIHANGYWEDRKLDNGFAFTDTLQKTLTSDPQLEGFAPRLESFALAATEEMSKGALVTGVDPEREKVNTQLHERVTEGSYFTEKEGGALIGNGLAEYLKLEVGDTLVLLGQGYRQMSAAGKYPIRGIVKFGSPELSKQLVFLPLAEAQRLYSMENMLTALILQPRDIGDTKEICTDLQERLGSRFEVMPWQELHPELVNMIETDRVEGYVFMGILYLVIGFGLLGTTLMMISERMHEFGVLVSIGMKRIRLALVVFLEILIISLSGAFLGMLGAYPVCAYFYYNPIQLGEDLSKMTEDYGMEAVLGTSLDPSIFTQQAAVVALIAVLIAVYPFFKLIRLDVIKTRRR